MEGLTIVVSGIFNEVSRERLEEMIAEYGGRCTGSVSGKTDYLVTGYKMEDGREVTQGGKYKSAKTKGTAIIDEQGFEQLMQKKLGDKDFKLGKKLATITNVPKAGIIEEPKDRTLNEMWTDRYAPRGF